MTPSKNLFVNQKGGVGKTTLLREIGFYLSSIGKRVLLVDCDPKGDLTKSLVVTGGKGLYEALVDDDIAIATIRSNLFLLQADKRLSAYSNRITGEIDAFFKISDLFRRECFQNYDFILFDVPPGFGTLTINCLVATNNIIIPMSPSVYSIHGANDLLDTIGTVRRQLNSRLNILGIIINFFGSNPVIIRQLAIEIKNGFSNLVFKNSLLEILRNEKAIAIGEGAIEDSSNSQAKKMILNIGQEFMERINLLPTVSD